MSQPKRKLKSPEDIQFISVNGVDDPDKLAYAAKLLGRAAAKFVTQQAAELSEDQEVAKQAG